ncbi:MAG: energy-coupling factor ABC transporter ATP-binding protein [Fibrobacter sp.]|nr:energy-coupling factor ABC transporter ATP-binding protein [Fibrobacter sp.]
MIRIENLSLRYSGASEPLIDGISLTIAKGETVLICGPTGCGKSSLINCMNGVLHHESSAQIKGDVYINGHDIRKIPLSHLCTWAGTVFQNPDTQICSATPESEIAFGLENQCVDRKSMKERIDEALTYTGLEHCRHQDTSTLSGGQKQRLVIACALALKPKILFLDEPVSQLDPRGAEEILALVNKLKCEHAYTIVLIEHRIDETFLQADRVIVMDKGRIVSDAPPEETLENLEQMRELGIKLPHLPDFFARINRPERPLIAHLAPVIKVCQKESDVRPVAVECLCSVENLTFGYTRGLDIIRNMSVKFFRGEHVALMGTNGAGKSTFLHLLAGAHKPSGGIIQWADKTIDTGLVLQSPDLMLFCETVMEECLFAPVHQGKTRETAIGMVSEIIDSMGLGDYAEVPPFALSKGQRLRVAVSSVLTKQSSILLLDEPTTGQDREHIERLMCCIGNNFELVIFCTHDVDTAARHADRVILLHQGGIIADGAPEDIFHDIKTLSRASIRQTSIQQYAVRVGSRAICVDELVSQVY